MTIIQLRDVQTIGLGIEVAILGAMFLLALFPNGGRRR